MKKVLAGLVTVAVAVVAVPTVAIGEVNFDNALKTSALNVVLPKETKQEEVKNITKEVNVATAEKVITIKDVPVVNSTENTTAGVVAANETVAVLPVNTKQAVVTTTQVSTTSEVTTTTVAPETAQETKQEEVSLGANDLFGLVGHPGNDYNTPEFQEKWNAMMAERTVDIQEDGVEK